MRSGRRRETPAASARPSIAGSLRTSSSTSAIEAVPVETAPRHPDPPRDGREPLGEPRQHGAGVPYAIAAKFAHPGRPVFALVGDGAMQMNGLAELLTVAKYRQRWLDQRFYVLVLHNNDLNQVTWEQRVMEGDPKFDASQDLPDVDYAAHAELFGLAASASSGPTTWGPCGIRRWPPIGRS